MGSSKIPSSRSLVRLFLTDFDPTLGVISLNESDRRYLRNVLRMGSGDEFVGLPGDGSYWRLRLEGLEAHVVEKLGDILPMPRRVVVAQAVPKNEKLDEVVRMGTELGVAEFVLFESQRTVQRWDEKKWSERLRRLNAIAKEAAEVCFRGDLPITRYVRGLSEVLRQFPDAIVLSESEGLNRSLEDALRDSREAALVIGPEGGWTAQELESIGARAATLGPLVLRVDTAAAAAIARAIA